MGDMVIVAYRPKAGQEEELLALVRDHVPKLRRLGLVTDRPSLMMHAKEGIIVEVFEWQDGALVTAHSHPEVIEMWNRYAAVCDYVPLQQLIEAREIFAQFTPINSREELA